jgi:hypothetical protein
MNENCKHLTLIITKDYDTYGNLDSKVLIRCANCTKINIDTNINNVCNSIRNIR